MYICNPGIAVPKVGRIDLNKGIVWQSTMYISNPGIAVPKVGRIDLNKGMVWQSTGTGVTKQWNGGGKVLELEW
jgi:hypothetical protein